MKKIDTDKNLEKFMEVAKKSKSYILIHDGNGDEPGALLVNGNAFGLGNILHIAIREMLKQGVPEVIIEGSIECAYEEAKKVIIIDKPKKEKNKAIKDFIKMMDGVIKDEK